MSIDSSDTPRNPRKASDHLNGQKPARTPLPRPTLEQIRRRLAEIQATYRTEAEDNEDFGLREGWRHMQTSRGWK
jgi:hypothetical protein